MSPLPTTETLEGAVMGELAWLVYGPPGIGKSTFFSKMEGGVLFLHTDPGLRFIKAFKQPINTWREFKKAVEELEMNKPSDYKFIVVDTVDLLHNMCHRHICKTRSVDHQTDLKYGKGSDMVNFEFSLWINKLLQLPYGVGFISHTRDVEIRGTGDAMVSKVVPFLKKQGANIIGPLVDIIGYAGYEEGSTTGANRVMIFEPTESLDAKDRTGMLPKSCPLDYDVISRILEKGGVPDTEPTKAPAARRAPARKKRRRS